MERARSALAFSIALLAACGPEPAPVSPPEPVPTAPPPPLPSAATASATVAAAPPPLPSAAPVAPPAPDPGVFPPPSFKPLVERTKKPGDGVWIAVPEGGGGATPAMLRTTVHPHAIKGHVFTAIVAIDLRRIDLRLVAGTEEPKSKSVPPEHRPGLVAADDLAKLIAVFNGGFMAKHGGWGMMLDGETYVPARDEGCTIGLYKDGALRIGSWPALKDSEPSMAAYRQTPPCLIEKGELHPVLLSEPETKKWGSSETGEREIRRSALGLDASGRTLFYGMGEWMSARGLAESMQAAGAVNVAEIDINWSYTRFLFFGRPAPGDPLQVTSTLVPKMKFVSQGYVKKPSDRDFFYLKKR
jgi:hypothetical protein